jgi:nucleoside-diphosphate-sugar epimerase
LRDVAADAGMEVVVLRPPIVYGPGVRANFLRLLKLVKFGFPLPLASIKNRRSLIYVGNLIDAIVTCLVHPKAAGETFLVSDGQDVSTPELIRRIAYSMGKPARLYFFPTSIIQLVAGLFGKSAIVDRLISSLIVNISKIKHELRLASSLYDGGGDQRNCRVVYKKAGEMINSLDYTQIACDT